MKNVLIYFLALLFIIPIQAQNKTNVPVIEAPFLILVQDMKSKPRKGEQILFVSKKTKKTYKGISNEKGEFKIKLPAGDSYDIKIKGIASNTDYSTFDVQKPPPGQEFDGESVITIQFEPAKKINLDNVQFDTGKATLRPESFKELNEVVEYMKWKTEEKIEIAGHTDNVGSEESNNKLSQDRAETITAYLISKGIQPERLAAKGYGATQPVADNSTEEGRQKNRRTEARILNK